MSAMGPSRRGGRTSGRQDGAKSGHWLSPLAAQGIAAGKVIVEFLGRQIDVRRALRNCGLFAHDSDEVAANIRQRLDNHIAPDAFVLLATEQ